MKASKITDAHKAFLLKQAEEGMPAGEICRKAGISQATLCAWRKKYAGLTPPEMRRLNALENEKFSIEMAGGGTQSRQGNASGRCAPKALRPSQQQEWVQQ